MTIRNKLFLSAAILAAPLIAAPAFAQAAAPATPPAAAGQATISVGAQVSDTQGGAVGTITKVDGDYVILKTDKYDVRLPVASFTPTDKGLLLGMTQAQVNAAVEQAQANAGPILSVGAIVHDTSGGVVGTVKEFDDQFATLQLSSGLIKLPVSAFGRGVSGPVIAMTAAELQAAANAQAPAQTSASTETTATENPQTN